MEAQMVALLAEREKLMEDGWKTVIAGRFENLRDSLMTMIQPDREFDPATIAKLEKIEGRRQKLEAGLEEIPEDDEKRQSRLQDKISNLYAEEQKLEESAPAFFSEATKSVASLFLLLYEDGQVRRECRIERRQRSKGSNGHSGLQSEGSDEGIQQPTPPSPPTCDDLAERQLAVTFTHQAVAVREALLKNVPARKRVLALILHDKVRSEALAVRHDANGTTLHATSEGFASPPFDRLREKREKIDPLATQSFVSDSDAYQKFGDLSPAKLDTLIELLTVECLTAHLQRRTDLVHHLAVELKVNIRDHWRPDAAWLSGYQKIQLMQFTTELKGPLHAPGERKKSELVDALATLFSDAAEGKLADKSLAEKLNLWLPSNLRDVEDTEDHDYERKNCSTRRTSTGSDAFYRMMSAMLRPNCRARRAANEECSPCRSNPIWSGTESSGRIVDP
jgi:hypothetical protein